MFVVTPSSAIQMTVIILSPSFNWIACDCVPDATGTPSTITRAFGSLVTGINVMFDTVSFTVIETKVAPSAIVSVTFATGATTNSLNVAIEALLLLLLFV